jgi:hypothetical protein
MPSQPVVHRVEVTIPPDQDLDVSFKHDEACFVFNRLGDVEVHRGHGRTVHLNVPPIRAGDAAWGDSTAMEERLLKGVKAASPVWQDEPELFKSTLHVLLRDGRPAVIGLALVVSPDPATIRARRLGWALINEDFLDD